MVTRHVTAATVLSSDQTGHHITRSAWLKRSYTCVSPRITMGVRSSTSPVKIVLRCKLDSLSWHPTAPWCSPARWPHVSHLSSSSTMARRGCVPSKMLNQSSASCALRRSQSKYDKFDPNRYLVIFITDAQRTTLAAYSANCSEVMTQPQRRVFLGANLERLLSVDPFRESILEDHRGLKRLLVPLANESQTS